MIEFALLGLLKERPMHGYDLRKRLREEFGPLSNLSYGSLYPALARLEADGAIQAVGADAVRRDPIPPTGSLGGERAATMARRATQAAALALSGRNTRGRKVYEITERGSELFDQLLESELNGDDARGFTLRLAFARHLSPAQRLRLLERRRIEVAARLDRAGRALRYPTRVLDRYEQAIAEHAEALVAAELAWLDELLRAENAALAPEEPSPPPGRTLAPGTAGTRDTPSRTAPAAAGAREGRNP